MSASPASRFLSVDLGNSRCKLRLWQDARTDRRRVFASAAFPTTLELPRAVGAWVAARAAEGPDPARAIHCGLSSVADAALEHTLVDALRGHLGADAVVRPDHGLELDVDRPETVGTDRLFAARAASSLVRVHGAAACVVVDAGTALTVDAVRCVGERGVFLGGAIAPGPELLADALARAARLPRVEPLPTERALGRTTEEALAAGVAVGFVGAARELVARVAADADLDRGGPAPVVCTGGALAFLGADRASLTERMGRTAEIHVDLVHLGLLLAWVADATGPGAAEEPGAAGRSHPAGPAV